MEQLLLIKNHILHDIGRLDEEIEHIERNKRLFLATDLNFYRGRRQGLEMAMVIIDRFIEDNSESGDEQT